MPIEWEGSGVDEVGRHEETGRVLVELMVEHDLETAGRLVTLRDEGYDVIEQGGD